MPDSRELRHGVRWDANPCGCTPHGYFEIAGQGYPSYIALCPEHEAEADRQEAVSRATFDAIHGAGAYDRKFNDGSPFT